MSNYKVSDTQLTSVANAIRAKTGSSEGMEFPDDFVSGISGLNPQLVATVRTVTKTFTYSRTIYKGTIGYELFLDMIPAAGAGPLISVEYNKSWTGASGLTYYIQYNASTDSYDLKATNAILSRDTVTIPANTEMTVTYYEYSVSI